MANLLCQQAKAAEESDSSSSPETDSQPEEPTQDEGSSSEDGLIVPAVAKQRGSVCMLTWSCPRHYASELQNRKKAKRLKPADLSKSEFVQAIKAELRDRGQLDNLRLIVAVNEKHKKYCIATQEREQHKHAMLQFKAPVAHESIRVALIDKHGIRAHFSFGLTGVAANLRYLLRQSAAKIEVDDQPEVWPPKALAELHAIIDAEPAGMAARNQLKTGQLQETQQAGRLKKNKARTVMTYNELTDIVVEQRVQTAEQFWLIAKEKKMNGDTLLWESLGKQASVSALVAKINAAWAASPQDSVIRTGSQYALDTFLVPATVQRWMQQPSTALVLHGPGHMQKTEMACAIMSKLVPSYLFVRDLEGLRDTPLRSEQGLVYDEANLSHMDVDAVKALLDHKHRSEIRGPKYRCAIKPAGLTVIFCTNHSMRSFLPPQAFDPAHEVGVMRRLTIVPVMSPLAKHPPPRPTLSAGDSAPSSCSDPGAGSSSSNLTPAAASQTSLGSVGQDFLRLAAQLSPGTKRKLIAVLGGVDGETPEPVSARLHLPFDEGLVVELIYSALLAAQWLSHADTNDVSGF